MALKRRLEPKPQSPLAARIRAQREPGRAEVSLERLEADFADASRYEIVASLKELEKAGSGQFFVGSKGQRSRFVWAREKAPDAARSGKKPARVAQRGKRAAPALGAAGAAAPALSSEPSPKGSTRKTLVPVGEALERLELSSRAGGEAPAPRRALGPRVRPPAAPQPETPAAEPVPDATSRTLRHTFHLRPGLLVSIELPEDVTATEVERFCSFLEAIPFAGSPRR